MQQFLQSSTGPTSCRSVLLCTLHFFVVKNPAICGISALPEKHIRNALAGLPEQKIHEKTYM
jgi:hypothetical protein